MKKLLFGIFSVLFCFVGFGFCDTILNSCELSCIEFNNSGSDSFEYYLRFNSPSSSDSAYVLYGVYNLTQGYGDFGSLVSVNQDSDYISFYLQPGNSYYICGYYFLNGCQGGGGSSCEDKSITIYYNSGNTASILCDGTQAILINGLSTITSTNTFTPYYNISYTDEDNQKLTESYSKDILYLENGQFKKTYTGNNDRILSVQGYDSENIFTGYVPVFDFTGDTIVNTGNVFNNFSDNALKVLLSNIPSYIQYITIFAILVFLFSFIRRFKRKS